MLLAYVVSIRYENVFKSQTSLGLCQLPSGLTYGSSYSCFVAHGAELCATQRQQGTVWGRCEEGPRCAAAVPEGPWAAQTWREAVAATRSPRAHQLLVPHFITTERKRERAVSHAVLFHPEHFYGTKSYICKDNWSLFQCALL